MTKAKKNVWINAKGWAKKNARNRHHCRRRWWITSANLCQPNLKKCFLIILGCPGLFWPISNLILLDLLHFLKFFKNFLQLCFHSHSRYSVMYNFFFKFSNGSFFYSKNCNNISRWVHFWHVWNFQCIGYIRTVVFSILFNYYCCDNTFVFLFLAVCYFFPID